MAVIPIDAFTAKQNTEKSLYSKGNAKGTTYMSSDKNSMELGFGYTYSNGYPLSADPSQMVYKCTPIEFSISYEAEKAFVVEKVDNIPTTICYTRLLSKKTSHFVCCSAESGFESIIDCASENYFATIIDCSAGNYFEYNNVINNQYFIFCNVPSTANTVYHCTLKCIGNVTIDNFPNNVNWSERSFYSLSGSDFYVMKYADINGDGSSSDTHIITFTTWDNGTTWYADDARYS